MKKLAALLLVMLLSLPSVFAEVPDGAWLVAEDATLTAENTELFEKALDGYVGVVYKPIAYLGSQVVNGVNHCFLCSATGVYPGAVTALALVYIHERFDGQTEVMHITTLDIANYGSTTIE